MLFIIALVLALCLVCFGDKLLKKHAVPFYIVGTLITILVIAVSQTDIIRSMPEFVRTYIIGIFSKGSFAAALWCIVMWAGALPNGSAAIKKIMPIRGELSILASAITLSHIVTYGIQYIKTLTNNIKLGRSFTSEFIITCIVVVVLTLIMLPLAVMSFKKIRKSMNPKTWKKIQRFAYIFYALIYIHIMVLYVPQAKRGVTDKYISIIIYSIVFLGYAAMRIRKALLKKNSEKSAASGVVCGVSAAILVAAAAVFSYGKAPERKTPDTQAMAVSTSANSDTANTTSVNENSSESTTAVSTLTDDKAESTSDETDTTDSNTDTKTTKSTKSTKKDSEDDSEEEDTETTPVDEEENEQEQEQNEESDPEPEQSEEGTPQESEPQPEPEPETEPEPQYIYNNGTYTGTAYGYAGDITVTITIENDVITDISAVAYDDDPDYYDYAMDYILPQIQQSLSADVDAYSGATYSSQGLMDAARQALSLALR